MAQWVNCDDPSSIPKTHTLEQVNSSKLSSDLHLCIEACMPTANTGEDCDKTFIERALGLRNECNRQSVQEAVHSSAKAHEGQLVLGPALLRAGLLDQEVSSWTQ